MTTEQIADIYVPHAKEELNVMTVEKLQRLCKEKLLPSTGLKVELVDRLVVSSNSPTDQKIRFKAVEKTEQGEAVSELEDHKKLDRAERVGLPVPELDAQKKEERAKRFAMSDRSNKTTSDEDK